MRLFIAIDFDKEDYFKKLQDQIKSDNLKATFPKAFHLTLKFLGETDKTEEIIKTLEKIKFKKLILKTKEMGVFPSENYVRVIWLGLEDHKELEQLYQNIEKELALFKFKKDYDFQAHITLARVKFIKDKELFKKQLKQIKPEQLEFNINKFILYQSTLTPKGPIYEEIKIFSSS
jgi:2'-5' RNA ligase